MNKLQRGFGVIEVCLILITITVIGFAGWFILVHQKPNGSTLTAAQKAAQDAENQRLNAEAAKYQAFYDQNQGFQFSYLKTWKAKAVTEDGGRGRTYTQVTSPDYVNTQAMVDGKQTYHKGAYIEVSSQKDVGFKTIDEYLQEGPISTESEIKNAKKIRIDGQPGVTYRLESIGPAKLISFTRANGKAYQIIYVDPNTADYEKYLPEYTKLVESFNIVDPDDPNL